MYELAKQLKDAGFPQNGGRTFFSTEGKVIDFVSLGTIDCAIPTLEELIDGCVEEEDICRYKIIRIDVRRETTCVECWRVDKNDRFEHNDSIFSGKNRELHKGVVIAVGRGKTPLEAVINLYIALNKK